MVIDLRQAVGIVLYFTAVFIVNAAIYYYCAFSTDASMRINVICWCLRKAAYESSNFQLSFVKPRERAYRLVIRTRPLMKLIIVLLDQTTDHDSSIRSI